jgi:hypothetical protein
MAEMEKLICGDCKGVTEFPKKRGSNFVETMLWATLFFPGFFYSIWRRKNIKKTCQYCGGDFLFPADMPHADEFLNPIIKK